MAKSQKAKGTRISNVTVQELTMCARGKNNHPVLLKSASADDDAGFLNLDDDEGSEDTSDAAVDEAIRSIKEPQSEVPVKLDDEVNEDVTSEEKAGLEKIEASEEEEEDEEAQEKPVEAAAPQEKAEAKAEESDKNSASKVVGTIVNLGVAMETAANEPNPEKALAKALDCMEALAAPASQKILKSAGNFPMVLRKAMGAALEHALEVTEGKTGDVMDTAREAAQRLQGFLGLEPKVTDPVQLVKSRIANIRKHLLGVQAEQTTPVTTTLSKGQPRSQSRTETQPQSQETEAYPLELDIND